MFGSSWTCQLQESTHLEIELITEVPRDEIVVLTKKHELYLYASQIDFPFLLKPLATFNSQHHLLFHIHINQEMKAVLILADSVHVEAEEAISNVRQLADQLGVSLSRAATVHELDNLNVGVLTALARTVDANSKWTHGHSERVTEYALLIAKELGFSESECNDLHHAGLLHDLGKVSIPAEILNKPGKLTDEEYNLVKAHPTEGERIIEPINAFKTICPIVRQHHERWDGKGYPDGLKGEAIHPGARVLAVADVYDALYSDRPYRDGWPLEKVVDYLKQESGMAFDPLAVQALIKSLPKLDSCIGKYT
jgi:HD-GYP domain-containing protein (c-di-GMP phosphodiesterase class II)